MGTLVRRLLHVIRRRRAERELREELELHLALKRRDLEKAGLDSLAAEAGARRAMGSRLLARDDARDVWAFPWLGGLALDVKLALRLMARYPLLTIVGGAAMAFGMAVGIGGFEVRTQFVDPALPLDEGDRIVGLRTRDVRLNRPGPVREADLVAWRDGLQSVVEIGAFAQVERNLIADGVAEPVRVAAMTASGFRIARVTPLLGRTLVEADELPGAVPVVVIGESLWKRRFFGDPAIVGRSIQLGREQTTIVGVLPERFGFPVAHEVWLPLSRQTAVAESAMLAFGRLAPGATLGDASLELTAVGQRMAADAPETHGSLRPEAVPYAHLIVDPRGVGTTLLLANVFLLALVVLIFANVALLMFARAATREGEVAVRTALGASRARIVGQLFIEAVVLAGLSIALGLGAARVALGSLWRTLEADSGSPLPFWVHDGLTPSTVTYGIGLMMLAALIAGVYPALKITGGRFHARLRNGAAGAGGHRFGGVWTGVIAAQVAVTVAFPAVAFFFHGWVVAGQTRDVGFAAEEYLSARLVLDRPGTRTTAGDTAAEGGRRPAATLEELRRRLTEEPGVMAVTFADRLPGMLHPGGRFEMEGHGTPPAGGHEARVASVDADFFQALGAPVLSGRAFLASDLASDRPVAIVNASFVDRVLGGRDALGLRVRRLAPEAGQDPGPWLDIVGVVPDRGVLGTSGVGLYRPLPAGSSTVHVAIHTRGAAESAAGLLRALARQVDPTLRVHDVMALDEVGADQWLESRYLSRLLSVLSGMALLLSLMAIHSVMAFTVAQRTGDIGIRVALGATRVRTLAAVVRRPLAPIGLGAGIGGALVVLASFGMLQDTPTPLDVGLIVLYATLMLAVCLLACVGPARRALRLDPCEALRADR